MTPPENERLDTQKVLPALNMVIFGIEMLDVWGVIPVDMVDKTLNYELEITRSIHGNGLFTDMYHLNSIKSPYTIHSYGLCTITILTGL